MKYLFLVTLVFIFAGLPAGANEPPSVDCLFVSRSDAAKSSLAQKLLDEFKEFPAIQLCNDMSNNEVDHARGLFATPDIGNFKVLEVRNLSEGRIRRSLGRKLPQIYAIAPADEIVRFQVCEKIFDCGAYDIESYFHVRNMTRNELSQILNEWKSIKSRSNLEFENQANIYWWKIWKFRSIKQKLNIQYASSFTNNTGEIIVQIHLVRPKYKRKWLLYFKREGNSLKLYDLETF